MICLKEGCGRIVRPGKPASTGKKLIRRKRVFCKLHSGMRLQMSKDSYNKLRQVSPPRKRD